MTHEHLLKQALELIEDLLHCHRRHRHHPHYRLRWTVYDPSIGSTYIGVDSMILTDLQQVALTVEADDAKGFATALTTALAWSSSDSAVAAVTGDDHGAVVVGVAPGTAQINVTTQLDPDNPGSVIRGAMEVQIVPSAAVSIKMIEGSLEAQPTTAPPADLVVSDPLAGDSNAATST